MPERWYGNSDHKTSESCYFTSQDYHLRDFYRMVRALKLLSRRIEGQRYRPVELIYENTEGPNHVIAYRWTSDEAYDKYDSALMAKHGLSLGRGVWNPFGSNPTDHYQLETYVMQKEAAVK